MAKITFDGQSFSLDGKRVWLVSGAIHYPRVPRELWRDRIRAAKQAGLNCIETYGFWNAHEPKPGEYDFTGGLDLRHFVELIAQEGMFCILRPGPFICAEWDNGGLPPWLHRVDTTKKSGPMKLREASAPFLAAASRYLTALLGQVSDLQITRNPRPDAPQQNGDVAAGGFANQGAGPIVMVQAENEWFCSNPDQEADYLQQLVRYTREAGIDVPINVCNQLWQEVDGTIHTWNASSNLAADLRQLRVVQPDAPRLVSEYWPGWFDHWGGKHADTVDADKQLYRLASILSTGAQYNLFMFHGGTNFGFMGGRTVNDNSTFMTTSYDYDAPLLEGGGRGPKYQTTKRISTFASHFGTLLAGLDPDAQPTGVCASEEDHPLSVTHLRGDRGDVVFVLKATKDKTSDAQLLLPNGLKLPVPLKGLRAAWLPIEVRLSNGTTLDFTNLSPFAYINQKLLVVFGPAGSDGVLSLDDALIQVKVPGGKTPHVEAVGDITLVVLNTEQVDSAYPMPGGLVVGCNGLDADGQPVPLKAWSTQFLIDTDGQTTRKQATVTRAPAGPKLSAWSTAHVEAYLDGSAPTYRAIKGPRAFEAIGNDFGYGWYHLELPKTSRAATKTLVPGSGDRLHVYRDGKLDALLGFAPGAEPDPTALRLSGPTTVLVDNLGRFNFGQRVGELKGLFSHAYAVKAIKLPKAERTAQTSPDPFELAGYIHEQRLGEVRPAEGFHFKLKPASRQPVVLEINGLPIAAVVKVNGVAVAVWHPVASAGMQRFVLDPADESPFTAGTNDIEFALFDAAPADFKLNRYITLHQTTANLTAKAKWSFSPWTMPDEDAFADTTAKPGQPTWFRTSFNVSSTRCPLFLHPKGMSKGQVYLNSHNVGRYFMQTHKKKPVPPQSLYYLPEPWLHTDQPNVLTLFDEHGFAPTDARLTYRELGPYG